MKCKAEHMVPLLRLTSTGLGKGWSFHTVAIVMLAWVTPLSAATYVVDGANPQAADENAGTVDHPFRTIGAATRNKLMPGDEVLIKAGTYREAVNVEASGTAEKPVTIAAYPGDEGKVVIKGSDLISDWKRFTESVWTIPWEANLDSHYPASWISQFRMADYGPLAKRCEMVFVGGQPLTQVLGTGLLRRGTFTVDETRHVLLASPAGDAQMKEAEVAVRQQGLKCHGNFLRIKGLTVMYVANPYEVGAMAVSGDDNVVENCRVEWNNLDGMKLGGHRIRATGNISNHNGDCGMVLSIQDSRFENNQTSDNSWRMGPNWHEGGVKIIGGKPAGNVIIRHVSKNNGGAGIWFDTCGANNRVDGCWLEGNLIAGVEFEACLGGNQVVVNNVICNARPIPDVLYPKADGAGIMLYESSGVKIQNNTIVGNARNGIVFAGAQRGNGAYCSDIEIRNNIIASNGTAGLVFWVRGKSAEPAVLATYRSDYNFWYQPQGKMGLLLTAQPGDLKDLQAAWGQDAHSVSGDPQFVDIGKGDYHLGAGSPAMAYGAYAKPEDLGKAEAKPDASGGPQGGAK